MSGNIFAGLGGSGDQDEDIFGGTVILPTIPPLLAKTKEKKKR